MRFAPKIALPRATRKNEIWVTDFSILDDSQRTKILIVLDVFTRLPVVLAILDSKAEIATQLVTHLTEAGRGLRYPEMLLVDAGLEVGSEKLTEWAGQRVIILYGNETPQKRSIVEPFLRRLSQFLSETNSLASGDLKQGLAEWRQHYKSRQHYEVSAD
jgi:transposase InsO family protein